MKRLALCLSLVLVSTARGQVVTYEGFVFPEASGWQREGSGRAVRSPEEGAFVQFVYIVGVLDAYRRAIAGFADAATFFVQWRVQTDAPASSLDSSHIPVVVSAGGNSYAFYHTTITDARVQLFRDTFIPLVFVDVEPGVPHTYRLEVYGDEWYAWYIDGEVVDSGAPVGWYPTDSSSLIWGVRHEGFDATTRWQYLRYGTIPLDGSGDYDSDGILSTFDFYFLHECLSAGAPGDDAGPGCRFADLDSDADVDLHDFALFQNAFTGGD